MDNHGSNRARLLTRACIALVGVLATATASAEFVRVTAANSVGNSVYDVTAFATPPCTGSACGTTSTLNTDGSSHGSFSSVVQITNLVTGTVDVLVADATKGQVIRYTPAYNSANNTPVPACTTVVWPSSGSSGTGPSKPDGLSLDANNNLYIVTNKKPALWVLPATSTYTCNTDGGYVANPLLIDATSFSALGDVLLRDTAVATDTTAAWGPGDLLVLVGSKNNANTAELTVYRAASIARVLAGGGALTGPDEVLVSPSQCPNGEYPVGFDFWPADSVVGHTTVLIATTAGNVWRYDFTATGVAAGYPTKFAGGLGGALQKLKVGLYQEVAYAFLTSTSPGSGEILQLGAPVAGVTSVLGIATTGVNSPDGLAVARAAAVAVTSCVNPVVPAGTVANPVTCDIGGKGVDPHSIYNGTQTVTGNIVESTCVVLADPRVSGGNCTAETLDVASVCPNFGHELIPATLCGGSGISGSAFAVVHTNAPGVDNVAGIAVYTQQNPNNIVPPAAGSTNPACPAGVNSWGPNSANGEGTVVVVDPVSGQISFVDQLVELTGFCDGGGSVSRGMSTYGIGLVLNPAATGSMTAFAQQKYKDLYATVDNSAIDGPTKQLIETTGSSSLSQIATYLAEGSPGDIACAANEVVQLDALVGTYQNTTASTWGNTANPNPYGEIRGRLANLYLTLNTRILGNKVNAEWPLAAPDAPPTCPAPSVTPSATPNPIAPGAASTINWSAHYATSCTAVDGDAGWSGPKNVSGSYVTANLASTTSYTLNCTGIGGTDGNVATVTVVPLPTLTLTPSLTNVTSGVDKLALTWSATDPVQTTESCAISASGPNSVNLTGLAASGTQTIGTLTATSATVTTYSLACTDSVGSISTTTAAVTVYPKPAPTGFAASPGSVTSGGASTLSWTESTGASCAVTATGSGNPVGGTVTGSGSVQATGLTATTGYTLTCSNPAGGTTTATTNVTVYPVPVIQSAAASPASVTVGGQTKLSWTETTGTATCSVMGPGLPSASASGALTGPLSGPSPATYTVTCTNPAGGSATAPISVPVYAVPVIQSAAASPASVTVGGTTKLSWTETTGTATCSVTGPGLATASASGVTTTAISSPSPATYTVTCTNPAGGSATAPITVPVYAVPVITSAVASPTSLTVGGVTKLSWTETTGTATCSVTGPGLAAAGASGVTTAAISSPGPATFTVTCTNPANGSATATIAVPVYAVPVIQAAVASPASVTVGGTTTLSWTETTGTATCSVTGPGLAGPSASGVTTAPISGPSPATYTVTCTDPANGSVTAPIAVPVYAVPVIQSPAASPASVTVGGTTKLSWTETTGTATCSVTGPGLTAASANGVTTGPISATGTASYIVTCTNPANGSATAPITVPVYALPVIQAAVASPASLTVGGATKLSWTETTGTATCSVTGPGLAGPSANGATTAAIGSPGTASYIVTCTNPANGSATATIAVPVYAVPSIQSAVASPASVTVGGTTKLSWTETTGTASCSVTGPGLAGPSANGVTTGSISSTGTATYTVTCTDPANGSSSATVAVPVYAVPVIQSAAASPASVTIGGTTKLSWTETTGTATCSVTGPGLAGPSASGVTTGPISSTGTATYTVSCTNPAGGVSSATILVPVYQLPAPSGFSVTPTSLTAGGSATLSWTENTGAACAVSGGSLNGAAGTGSGGSYTLNTGPVTAVGTTTFTLKCVNPAQGAATAQTSVTVYAAPSITKLTATPSQVDGDSDRDDSVTLAWTSSNATSCSVSNGTSTWGSLGANSSLAVGYVKTTTTFTLKCVNQAQGSATATTTVTLKTGDRD